MKYYNYSFATSMDDNNIIVDAALQDGSRKKDIVARDGSQVTNFKAACETHRQISLSLIPSSTTPPCSVSSPFSWVIAQPGSSTVTTAGVAVSVPFGNSGVLVLAVNSGTFTAQYSIAGGAFTTFTTGATITVTNGQTLAFQAIGLTTGTVGMSGTVTDQDTSKQIGMFAINFNF